MVSIMREPRSGVGFPTKYAHLTQLNRSLIEAFCSENLVQIGLFSPDLYSAVLAERMASDPGNNLGTLNFTGLGI